MRAYGQADDAYTTRTGKAVLEDWYAFEESPEYEAMLATKFK